MKLPIIRKVAEFAEENDADFIEETIETLEAIAEVPTLKTNEVDVIGELLSNLYGGLEVHRSIAEGMDKKTALKTFMDRVMGAIDR